MNDGHEVLGKLLGPVLSSAPDASIPFLVIDDQSNVASVENELEKLEPEADESIPVGDNNFLDKALDALDDQTAKTGAVVTNSRTDIFDNNVSGMLLNKIRNLSIQTSLLLARRYSAIYVPSSSFVVFLMLMELKNSLGIWSGGTTVGPTKGRDVVEADISWGTNAADEALRLPGTQG